MVSGPRYPLGTLAGLLPVFLAVLALAGCSQVTPPNPELLAQARGDQCVEPTDLIRREHMHLLMHERDQAKRLGIRNPEHSFVGCIDCHVSPLASKDEPAGHFCLACHAFNAVKMDCFQCHLDRPATALSAEPAPALPFGLTSVALASAAPLDSTSTSTAPPTATPTPGSSPGPSSDLSGKPLAEVPMPAQNF